MVVFFLLEMPGVPVDYIFFIYKMQINLHDKK